MHNDAGRMSYYCHTAILPPAAESGHHHPDLPEFFPMRLPTPTALILLTSLPLTPAAAATQEEAPPYSVQRLLGCRQIADAAQRLACFDRESAPVNASLQSRELVIIDKEKARTASRTVFGFSVPNFGGLFGSKNEVSSIQSTVRSARRMPYGGYTLALADGSIWSQTDDSPLGFPPKGGDPVTIRRGALGSFVMQVGRQPSVKVKRVE